MRMRSIGGFGPLILLSLPNLSSPSISLLRSPYKFITPRTMYASNHHIITFFPFFATKPRPSPPSFLSPPLPRRNNITTLMVLNANNAEVEEETSLLKKARKFTVIGHRGNGMNSTADLRMKDVKENSILSFETASSFNLPFIELDVQVTKDGVPIIFHDDFILTNENGTILEKRVTDLNLSEFLSYGPQKEEKKIVKPLYRKTREGRIISWDVKMDDSLCTLKDAFEKVPPQLGFDIELKFDDYIIYPKEILNNVLQSVLQVVYRYAKDRPIMFSTFEPDAALLLRKEQEKYPVLFLTNGGTRTYHDSRRNSLEEACKLCLNGGLQGIVSEVKGVFSDPATVTKIKGSSLSLFTYGTLNNVAESVYLQYLMGVDGVVVDYVQEIMEAINGLIDTGKVEDGQLQSKAKPKFSERELSFLLKLVQELIKDNSCKF